MYKYSFALLACLLTACGATSTQESALKEISSGSQGVTIFDVTAQCIESSTVHGPRYEACDAVAPKSIKPKAPAIASAAAIKNLPFHQRVVMSFDCSAQIPTAMTYSFLQNGQTVQNGSVSVGERSELIVPVAHTGQTLNIAVKIDAANVFKPGCKAMVSQNYVHLDYDYLRIHVQQLISNLQSVAKLQKSATDTAIFAVIKAKSEIVLIRLEDQLKSIEFDLLATVPEEGDDAQVKKQKERERKRLLSDQKRLKALVSDLEEQVIGVLAEKCPGISETDPVCPAYVTHLHSVLKTEKTRMIGSQVQPLIDFLHQEKIRLMGLDEDQASQADDLRMLILEAIGV